MNDYIVGSLASDRQAGFIREVEHDELVAQAHRDPEGSAAVSQGADRPPLDPPVPHGWRRLRALIYPSRPNVHGHRP
jgi:hypothetical protein